MALIKCPECGESVSNLAKNCIHCGFPIMKTLTDEYDENVCIIDGKPLDLHEFKDYIDDILDNDGYLSKDEIESLVDSLHSDCLHSSKDSIRCLIHIMINSRQVPREHTSLIYRMQLKSEEDAKYRSIERKRREAEERYKLHCPKCNSTNITTGSRGYNIVWGFIGSGKTVNRCGKCGHKWEPKK